TGKGGTPLCRRRSSTSKSPTATWLEAGIPSVSGAVTAGEVSRPAIRRLALGDTTPNRPSLTPTTPKRGARLPNGIPYLLSRWPGRLADMEHDGERRLLAVHFRHGVKEPIRLRHPGGRCQIERLVVLAFGDENPVQPDVIDDHAMRQVVDVEFQPLFHTQPL